MTPLRQRMIIDMSLAAFKPKTQQAYLHAAIALAKHFNRSPEFITETELKEYFFHLVKEKKLAKSTLRQKYCGIRFLFEKTLGKPFPVFKFLAAGKEKRLPNVLSVKEVRRSLAEVKQPVCAMVLKLMYGGGLRINEALNMRTPDLDRDRMMYKVRLGKGGKDRYLPLAPSTLKQLENYWRNDRPKNTTDLLFPSQHNNLLPVCASTVRRAFRLATERCGITKHVTPHSLRHSFASHLLDVGVSIKTIQFLLGHKSLTTTLVYMHVTDQSFDTLREAMDKMVFDL